LTRAEQARRTRAQITAVALKLFADKGYDATSLQDIADEMGLTKPAVYYHFKGKGEILRELTEPTRHAVAELMERVRALPLGPERVDLVVREVTDLFLGRHDVAGIVGQQSALRDGIQDALGGQRMLDGLVEALFGPTPTLDQRFAVYCGTAFGRAVQPLGDVPEETLRGVIERALRRIAEIR
jgi:AcrR family transcriptional regulator